MGLEVDGTVSVGWLAMAGQQIVDAHFHLWDRTAEGLVWDWLAPGTPHPLLGAIDPLQEREYRVADYLADARPHGVTKAVHVQAAIGSPDPVRETEWLQAYADRTGFPHGIVAHADLKDPAVDEVLERHCAFANMRGIRDFSYGDYLTEAAWHRGFARLGKYGLSCDLDCTWERMAPARDLAAKFSDTVIVLDHAGFPQDRTPEYFAAWRAGMATLAQAENVVCKISGLGMGDHLAGGRWSVDSLRPYVDACLDTFGVRRCLFGSNWPVDSLFGDYGPTLAAYLAATAGLTDAERAAVFAGNATRVYRL
jgi:predicted TIM-barrel fold metal-dependent hydrolase